VESTSSLAVSGRGFYALEAMRAAETIVVTKSNAIVAAKKPAR
jgi:hypothetical protein